MSSLSNRDPEIVNIQGKPPLPVQRQYLPAVARDTPLSQCPTNLDLTSKRGRALAIAAGNPGDLDLGGSGSLTVVATEYLLYPSDGIDPETGEVHEFTRTCLFDKNGLCFRTTSAHAPGRLHAILSLFGTDDWKRGVPIMITERRSRKTGRTYHDIRIDPEYYRD